MGKGEVARYEQFLLFPQCFQKACFPGASKGVVVWEWVKYCSFSVKPQINKSMLTRCTGSFIEVQKLDASEA